MYNQLIFFGLISLALGVLVVLLRQRKRKNNNTMMVGGGLINCAHCNHPAECQWTKTKEECLNAQKACRCSCQGNQWNPNTNTCTNVPKCIKVDCVQKCMKNGWDRSSCDAQCLFCA